MIQPRWLSVSEVLRLHEIQIERYGGRAGIRDRGLLQSAVIRPQNRYHYDGVGEIVELAATYAVAISANHPFFDGNKRTAFYAMAVCLDLHATPLSAPEDSATEAMLKLAASDWDAARFLTWLRDWV